MKIASFNINGVRGRLPTLLRWLEEAAPDVVCLQELKAQQQNFPEAEINAAGYGAIWKGERSWNGVAILARDADPIETRRHLPGDSEDVQSRYLEAAVRGVLLACLYAPNGNPTDGPKLAYKLRWLERLEAHAADLIAQDVPVALAGDFNIIPTAKDVYKPEHWQDDALFHPKARAAFERLQDAGWVDALRKLHPNDQVYTFWDYLRNAYERNAGLRIDHILMSPRLSPRLKAAGIDTNVRGWKKPSDHAPVWITLKRERHCSEFVSVYR